MITNIPQNLRTEIERLLHHEVGSACTIKSFLFVGGGSINQAGQLRTSCGNFFLKWNDAHRFPGMFEKEALGLMLLSRQKMLTIPTVLGYGNTKEHQFLLLQYIESSQKNKRYWFDLGVGLAKLHQLSSATFGLDHDNYMGSLPQSNKSHNSWIDFFIHERLKIQISLAVKNGLVNGELQRLFEKLYTTLPELVPDDKPALLHGDLWCGNVIADSNGGPCIIDPAVYYGNREADLAMTKLFGGFNEEFYNSYSEAFPLLKDYEKRLPIYNLYPLLVHLNLFGRSYLSQIYTVFKQLMF